MDGTADIDSDARSDPGAAGRASHGQVPEEGLTKDDKRNVREYTRRTGNGAKVITASAHHELLLSRAIEHLCPL